MSILANIWSTITQKWFGGGGYPTIPITTLGGTKLYALLAEGDIPKANSLAIAVGLSRTLKI